MFLYVTNQKRQYPTACAATVYMNVMMLDGMFISKQEKINLNIKYHFPCESANVNLLQSPVLYRDMISLTTFR